MSNLGQENYSRKLADCQEKNRLFLLYGAVEEKTVHYLAIAIH